MFTFFRDVKNRVVTGCQWAGDRLGVGEAARERRRLETVKRLKQQQLLDEFGLTNIRKCRDGTTTAIYFGSMGDQARIDLPTFFRVHPDKVNEMCQHGDVAIKLFWDVQVRGTIREYHRENNQIRKMHHPNIVEHFTHFQVFEREHHENRSYQRLINHFTEPELGEPLSLVIMMERLGDDLIVAKKKLKMRVFKEDEILHWFRCIGRALLYLHRSGVTHENLSMKNMCLSFPIVDREDFTHTPIKLIDFGASDTTNIWVYQKTKFKGLQGLTLWENEEQFLKVQRFISPRRSNPFALEVFLFARTLMIQSMPRRNCPTIFAPILPWAFSARTSIKNPKLRKALLLMAVNDERLRLNMEQALEICDRIGRPSAVRPQV